jgi:hypothetical protein
MDAVLELINVLHEPAAVFERIREKPRVLVPTSHRRCSSR